jgi:hypothetical protein
MLSANDFQPRAKHELLTPWTRIFSSSRGNTVSRHATDLEWRSGLAKSNHAQLATKLKNCEPWTKLGTTVKKRQRTEWE